MQEKPYFIPMHTEIQILLYSGVSNEIKEFVRSDRERDT